MAAKPAVTKYWVDFALNTGARKQIVMGLGDYATLITQSKKVFARDGGSCYECPLGLWRSEPYDPAVHDAKQVQLLKIKTKDGRMIEVKIEGEQSEYYAGFAHGLQDAALIANNILRGLGRKTYQGLMATPRLKRAPKCAVDRSPIAVPPPKTKWTPSREQGRDENRDYMNGYTAGRAAGDKAPVQTPLEEGLKGTMDSFKRPEKKDTKADLRGWAAAEPVRMNPFETPTRSAYTTF